MPGGENHPVESGPVYCIVVTYNGMAWIERCLTSLIQSSCPVTVLVVDNGSVDGTPTFIGEKLPQARLLTTGRNLGFGQANNIGLRLALEGGAGHVFLLNQDAWIEKDTIRDLVMTQQENPEFGILSPLQLNGQGNALDVYFADYLLASDMKGPVNSWLLGRPGRPALIGTSFVNAAAWLISAECLRETGGFDPIFFHYGEDVNYSQRVLFHGFRIGVHTGTRICHDREQRLAAAPVPAAVLKKDRIYFLNQACDIRKNGFMALALRRSLRYSLGSLAGLFNKNKRVYNFQMAKTVLSMIPAIRRSRRSATDKPAFLIQK